MRTIHRAKPITTDEWVHRLNALARQMDELCEGVHPSAWHELTAKLQDEFQRVAQMHTYDPPRQMEYETIATCTITSDDAVCAEDDDPRHHVWITRTLPPPDGDACLCGMFLWPPAPPNTVSADSIVSANARLFG